MLRPLTALVVLLAISCSSTAPAGPAGQSPVLDMTPKKIVAGILGEPTALNSNIFAGTISSPGAGDTVSLTNGKLGVLDNNGVLQPHLAESIPTVVNGLWKLLPDGRMETTWKLRPNVRWHDGAPVTAEDVLFTATVTRDRELPAFRDPAYDFVDAVEAVDASTVLVRWKSPYIEADRLFASQRSALLPERLLSQPYTENKSGFGTLSFWTSEEEFKGAGPYTLRQWDRGSAMVFQAFDGYVLGRPKIEIIEVRFLADPSVLVANLISGNVDLSLGRTVSLEQALEIASRWPGGTVERPLNGLILMYPQLLTPSPAIVGDAQFRRAMLHAIDRQALVDVLQYGQTSIGHSFLPPDQPEYPAVQSQIVRYDYDQRRAREILAGLGYQPAGDGALRDASNQRLTLELRSSNVDINQKSMFAVADYWGQLGIQVDPVTVSPERIRDQEYVATFPAFNMFRGTNPNAATARNWQGSRIALPENNYQVTGNNSRYKNAELDALIERYFVTIPTIERTGVLGQIVNHVTDRVLMLGLFFNTDPVMIGQRLKGVGYTTWNIHEWTVTS